MSDLKRIEADCVPLEGTDGADELANLAFLSLRVAMRSYLKTYQTIRHQLDALTNPHFTRNPEVSIDELYPDSYIEASAETIIHFQHFTELICKDILRHKHPLLPTIAPEDPVLFYKALMGQQIDDAEGARINTVEFRLALTRLCALVRKGIVDKTLYGFFDDKSQLLTTLNRLRNRIWHRGAHVLRYLALDEFVIRYLLPFVDNVGRLAEYQCYSWRPRDLHCGVEPIDALINAGKGRSFDSRKSR